MDPINSFEINMCIHISTYIIMVLMQIIEIVIVYSNPIYQWYGVSMRMDID